MTNLPITHMTLYKHGVGFFERRAELTGEKVELSFRVEEMNDILKSLTVIDWGEGQVLGVDYATPQSREERLAGCSVRLDDERSLRDLLSSLRGRQIQLHLNHGGAVAGTLLGLDEPAEDQPLADTLVSILGADADTVKAFTLGELEGVEILDDEGAGDLRFFLKTHAALSKEDYRSVTIRLSPGAHELSVSYVAPAPTWRVSYRMVAQAEASNEKEAEATGEALLQGWGIFDNRLEEDLEEIELSLVAGMPISFIYDLYTPFTPERPVIEEEARVAAGPVEFGAVPQAMKRGDVAAAAPAPSVVSMSTGMTRQRSARRLDMEEMEEAVAVETESAALGELFQYNIATPVTVGRGQSAMVPIIQSRLTYRKDLIYNGRKMAEHPVATMRLENNTGLTLERGPVTVIEEGEYVGEAVLPFTVSGSEVVAPYAVELAVKVNEENGRRREVRGLDIEGAYLQFEEWDIHWREYQLTNTTSEPLTVLIEHPRSAHYDLFDTPEPHERTDAHLRFEVTVPGQDEVRFKVQERRLTHRSEEIRKQSYTRLEHLLRQGLLHRREMDQLTQLLQLWERRSDHQKHLAELEQDREKIYKAQQQIQGNMEALGQTGKEGALRLRYVERLEETEASLGALVEQESEIRAEIKRTEEEIAALLERL